MINVLIATAAIAHFVVCLYWIIDRISNDAKTEAREIDLIWSRIQRIEDKG